MVNRGQAKTQHIRNALGTVLKKKNPKNIVTVNKPDYLMCTLYLRALTGCMQCHYNNRKTSLFHYIITGVEVETHHQHE